MAMKTHQHSQPDVQTSKAAGDNTSLSVPRSQLASTTRSSIRQPLRNFSSPFRPPSDQDVHVQSINDHQQSRSNTYRPQIPTSRYQQALTSDRTSYDLVNSTTSTRSSGTPKQSMPSTTPNTNTVADMYSSQAQHGVVRQASIGHRARPALLEVRRSDSTRTSKLSSELHKPTPNEETMDTSNTVSVSAGANAALVLHRSDLPRRVSNFHAPHDSPSSTYSQDFHSQQQMPRAKVILSGIDSGRVSPLDEESQIAEEGTDRGGPSPVPDATPHSERSELSTKPLLGLGIEQQDGIGQKLEEVNPVPLNLGVTPGRESTASITSLPDLIRRATRLAANLDRGKTASRLGLLDMFSNAEMLNTGKRESTFSDVLNSFPDPATGTPTRATRPSSTWPGQLQHAQLIEKQEEASPKERKACCGLSMMAFIIVVVIIILLVAASILIPILLVVIPRQRSSSMSITSVCANTKSCANAGVSFADGLDCLCICVDGFTGSDCSKPMDPDCITTNITDGPRSYTNATVGSAVASLLLNGTYRSQLKLNSSILLAVFANNNYSCASEDSLVEFDLNKRQNRERSIVVHSIQLGEQTSFGILSPATTNMALISRAIARRSSNLDTIIDREQAYSTLNTIASVTSVEYIAATSSPTSTAAVASTAKATIVSQQLEFAQTVVLYILAETRNTSSAVLAQQNFELFFRAGGTPTGNTTVDLGEVDGQDIVADMANLAIRTTNGKLS